MTVDSDTIHIKSIRIFHAFLGFSWFSLSVVYGFIRECHIHISLYSININVNYISIYNKHGLNILTFALTNIFAHIEITLQVDHIASFITTIILKLSIVDIGDYHLFPPLGYNSVCFFRKL